MDVRRSNPIEVMKDHEDRINRLERAPGGTSIYIDDRVITDPVEVVTFTGFPSREILELTWEITLDASPGWIAMLFNGEYPSGGDDYRWRLFGDVSANSDDDGNACGAIGGDAVTGTEGGPSWGRARFIDYDEATGAHGIIYQGDGGVMPSGSLGDDPSTFLISGYGDPLTPLTEISVFGFADGGTGPDGTKIVAPSRLTLTCY